MTKTNLTPLLLDGREASNEVLKNIKDEISNLISKGKRIPGLAVILVGDNPASHTYVKNKEKACKEVGIYSEVYRLSSDITEANLIKTIKDLNTNNKIDGILVQLPLPKQLNTENIISSITPSKDIDGLHPENLGKLIRGENCLRPCTPQGIIELLKYYKIQITGKKVVVIGRSSLVGKPLSLLLLEENATVTIAHSKTENIKEITKTADILIAAIGKAGLVKKDWVKQDSVLVDVGINKTSTESKKIVGDIDFEDVNKYCKAITPVPGGVGPMTIAMLMANTLKAYKINKN